MTLSPQAVALLKAIEQLRLKPYDDQTSAEIVAWVPGATIGYGHLIAQDEWDRYKDGLTADAADALFRRDGAPFEAAVGDIIGVPLQQHEYDALVILAYNIGTGALRGSSVAKLINDPQATTGYSSVEAAWKAWNHSQGRISKGLVNRRAAEWRIYSAGIYERW